MKRNNYTKEFENFVRKNVSNYTKEDFRLLLQNKLNIELSSDALRRYLNRKHIKERYKDYKKSQIRLVKKDNIGTEIMTPEGIYVKVAQPDKWRRKSRVMYEKYHNCKLRDDEYIVFLNQNNTDFSKENLIKLSKSEIAYLHNFKTFSSDPKLTKLGILSAKLFIKTKEKQMGGD